MTLEGHIDYRYDGELTELHLLIVELGGLVLNQLNHALTALRKKDLNSLRILIEREDRVNALSAQSEDKIIGLISKRSPLAKDLRIVMAFSKAITDLERVGNEAIKVAHLTHAIHGENAPPPLKGQFRGIKSMGSLASELLERALRAIDTLNYAEAVDILNLRDELEEEFEANLRRLSTYLLEDARSVGLTVNITLAVKALERIAAYAINLAEYIVFLVAGVKVRTLSLNTPSN